MTHSNESSPRDWLVIYTDLEILIIQKIFELKTNLQIGKELGLSGPSINIKILTIFKKLGVRTGLASKNLILYHFGTRHSKYLPNIKNFVMPPSNSEIKESKFIKQQELDSAELNSKIDFILANGGYGVYDKQKILYTREQLLKINTKFLDKIFKRTCKEVDSKESDARNLAQMINSFPVLSVGIGQHNGISCANIFSTDFKRILLLFPRHEHEFIKNEEGKTE